MKFKILTLLLCCSLLSCVSTKIESNKVAGYEKKVARIYLKVYTTKESRELLTELTGELKIMLEQRKIQVKWGKIPELDLGEDAAKIQEEMAFFHPDLILTLKMDDSDKNWSYRPYGGAYYNETNKLSATLGNYPLDQAVWKAIMRSRASLPGLGAHNIAKKLVSRLELDGMISTQ
jgi:hypothetical protein